MAVSVFKFIDTVSIERSSAHHPGSASGGDGVSSPRKFSMDTNQLISVNEKILKKKKSISLQGSLVLDLKSSSTKRRNSNLGNSEGLSGEAHNLNAGRDRSLKPGSDPRLFSADNQPKFSPLAPSLTTLDKPAQPAPSKFTPYLTLAAKPQGITTNIVCSLTLNEDADADSHAYKPEPNQANLKCFQKLSSGSTHKVTSKFTQQDSLCPGGPPMHSATITSRFGLNVGSNRLNTFTSQVSSRLHPQMSMARDDALSRADTGIFRMRTKSLLQVQGLGAELGETIELDQQGQGSEESARESSKKRYQPKVESNSVYRLDTQIDLGHELTQSKHFTNYMEEREHQMRLATAKLAQKYQAGGKFGISKSIIRETTAEDETIRASQKFPSYEAYPSLGNKVTIFSGSSNQQHLQASDNSVVSTKVQYPAACSSPIPKCLEFKNTLTSYTTGKTQYRVTLNLRSSPKVARSISLKTLKKHFLERSKSRGISLAMGPSF